MRMAARVQGTNRIFDLAIDPCRRAIRGRFGAKFNNPLKRLIKAGHKPPGFERFGKRARKMKAIKRQYAALLGFNPINLRRLAIIRHGKNALRIGAQQ